MQTLWQDLRYGARMLLKQPGFTLIAVLTLALGIGANTAIFSVVNAVLLRPLPYLDGERFIAIESFDRSKGAQQTAGLAPGNFWEIQQSTQSFVPLVGLIGSGFNFPDENNPEAVPGAMVTASLFQAANVRPLLGRVIEDSDACENCPGVILLSHRLWQRRFGGDPNIVGKTLPGIRVQVIGVMPPDFKYPALAEVWQPLPPRIQAQDRASRYFQVYGLLKPGVTLAQANSEMQSIAAGLEQTFPKENKNLAFALMPFRERLSRDVRTSLLMLLGAVVLVLLIACANVASLLLSRSIARRRELAIRAALGATRGRLVQQWLGESLLLASLSATLGGLLALWAREALLKLLPATYAHLQLQDQLQTDVRVLAFTLAVALLTGLLTGLFPAWQVTRAALGAYLKDGRNGGDQRETLRVRNALVVAEVALAFVLLIGAGLLINSFVQLQRVELGFDPQRLFGVDLSVPMNKPPAERIQLIRQLQEAAANTPEVEAAAITTGNVFPYLNFQLNRVNNPLPASESVLYDAVGPNYFTVLRGGLRSGRYFTEQDTAATEPVALINETLARRFFTDADPLDRLVTLNYLGKPQQRRIVGVVRNLNQGELSKIQPQLYVPYAQQPWFSASLVARAKTTPDAARRAVHTALKTVDAKQSVGRMKTAEALLAANLSEPRLYMALLSLFGALSLVLSSIGLFGQISYGVMQRTREFGVRIALGAQPHDILRQVIGHGMGLAVAGLLIGLVTALVLTKSISKLLYGVSATDPMTFAVIAAVLLGVALLACWIPARRATKVDPMIALRTD